MNIKVETLLPPDKINFLLESLREADGVSGLCIEVGCYKGGALALMATERPDRRFLGFDTFAGLPSLLPEDVGPKSHKAGDFSDSVYEEVKTELARIGVPVLRREFPLEVPPLVVAFCHLDVDLYLGTIMSLIYLKEHLKPGGLIVVDDYDWPRTPGVRTAVDKFIALAPEFRVRRISDHCQILIERVK